MNGRPPFPGRIRPQYFHSRGSGFSVIEVIGVLALVAILTLVVVVAVMKRMQVATQEAEAKTMTAMGLAFEKVFLERKTLPGTNDWAVLLAPELDRGLDSVRFTRSGAARMLIYHPSCGLKPGGSAVIQTVNGFTNVAHDLAKVIIVSTLGRSLPAALNPSSGSVFTNLWNLQPHQRPSGWTASDLPDPDDLYVARVDLGQHLHRVVLNNVTSIGSTLSFAMDYNGTLTTLSKANSPWQRSYIHGTGLNLHGLDGLVQAREIINEDRTFFCGDGGWGTYMTGWANSLNSQVVTYVQDFLNASFPSAANEQRPRASIDELYRAMWAYMFWAEDGFVEGGNNKKQAPDPYVERSTVARLNEGTLNLLGKGGSK